MSFARVRCAPQPARKRSRTERVGLSTLRSTSAMRLPGAQGRAARRRPAPRTDGAMNAGITCERPCPGRRARAGNGRRPAAARRARSSRSSSLPEPSSRIANPAVACGTKTVSSPIAQSGDESAASPGQVDDGGAGPGRTGGRAIASGSCALRRSAPLPAGGTAGLPPPVVESRRPRKLAVLTSFAGFGDG